MRSAKSWRRVTPYKTQARRRNGHGSEKPDGPSPAPNRVTIFGDFDPVRPPGPDRRVLSVPAGRNKLASRAGLAHSDILRTVPGASKMTPGCIIRGGTRGKLL
jgi:hypothetical protein